MIYILSFNYINVFPRFNVFAFIFFSSFRSIYIITTKPSCLWLLLMKWLSLSSFFIDDPSKLHSKTDCCIQTHLDISLIFSTHFLISFHIIESIFFLSLHFLLFILSHISSQLIVFCGTSFVYISDVTNKCITYSHVWRDKHISRKEIKGH